MSVGLLLIAGAVLLWPGNAVARRFALERAEPPRRVSRPVVHAAAAVCAGVSTAVLVGGVTGAVVGLALGPATWWALRRSRHPRKPGADVLARLRLAGTLDLLAAALRAGLPVPTALDAVSDTAPGELGAALRSASALLALGAGPAEAWAPVAEVPGLGELASAAIRTARSGAAFAEAASDLAVRLRDGLAVEAEERAERAGVALTLPVGLCFLPAFFCLGLLPVVLGLTGRLAPLF